MAEKTRRKWRDEPEKEAGDDLSRLVHGLCTSGLKVLDQGKAKEFKRACRLAGDSSADRVFDLLLCHLCCRHSEARLSAFQLCDLLFPRWEAFRSTVCTNLPRVLQLTTALPSASCPPLPPPHATAKELRSLAARTVRQWDREYGSEHKELGLATHFLSAANLHENEEEVSTERTQSGRYWEERAREVVAQMSESEQDVMELLAEAQSCFAILLPPPEEFSMPEVDEGGGSQSESKVDLRAHGVIGPVGVTVDLGGKLPRGGDEAVLEALRGVRLRMVKRFLPSVRGWERVLSRAGEQQDALRKAVDMKQKIQAVLVKMSELDPGDECSSSDHSDLEEVPAKPTSQLPASKSGREWTLLLGDAEDPTTMLPTLLSLLKKSDNLDKPSAPVPSTSSDSSRKQRLLSQAPRIPFDVDLMHWGQKVEPTEPPPLKDPEIGHRFWRGCSEPDNPPMVDTEATRVVEFSGQFEPVKWSCRAPLPSGRLCPRRDRLQCPFHGSVIPRDEMGRPVRDEDIRKEEQRRAGFLPGQPEYKGPVQDAALLKDIMATTGLDLKVGKKRKGKPKKDGLTPLTRPPETSRSRLMRKIGRKSAVKKVHDTLDRLDHKRHRDKFGDQFNYMHGTA